MDKLLNIAQEKLAGSSADKEEHGHGHGGQLPPGNKSHGGAYPLFKDNDDDDHDDDKLAQEASRRAGASGSSDMFAQVLGALGGRKGKIAEDQGSDIDEEYAVKKHQKSYKDNHPNDDDDENDDRSLGTAAAMQALKLFSSGQAGGKQSQGAFMALAMAEATKLFDAKASQGKVASSASKQSTAQQAAEVALKMYLRSQGGGKGGKSSGSAGGLMSLASKFL